MSTALSVVSQATWDFWLINTLFHKPEEREKVGDNIILFWLLPMREKTGPVMDFWKLYPTPGGIPTPKRPYLLTFPKKKKKKVLQLGTNIQVHETIGTWNILIQVITVTLFIFE